MPSFDETKAQFDALYGGKLEFSQSAFDAFATPRTPSVLERAFTTKLPVTGVVATAAAYGVLAARIAILNQNI